MRRIFTTFLSLCLVTSLAWGQGQTFDVFTNADSGVGSLRQAILDANANGTADQDIINIQVQGTITIVTEDFQDINLLPRLSNIIMNGNQITLARGDTSLGRFFQLEEGSIVRGITFDGGNSRLTGGAIFLAGIATVENCLFINNTAGNGDGVGFGQGGAIRVSSNSTATIADCIFTNNRAQRGAAIIVNQNATLNLLRSEFIGNIVDPQTNVNITPAVIYNDGTASLDDNIIWNLPLPTGTVDLYDSGNTVIRNVNNLVGSIGGPGANLNALAGGVASMEDPMLGPLQDNGGATFSFAPTAASPEIVQSMTPPQQVVVPPLQPETIELIEMLEREAADLPAMNTWGIILLMVLLLGLGSYLLFSNKQNLLNS